jgi:hypothetical protein
MPAAPAVRAQNHQQATNSHVDHYLTLFIACAFYEIGIALQYIALQYQG